MFWMQSVSLLLLISYQDAKALNPPDIPEIYMEYVARSDREIESIIKQYEVGDLRKSKEKLEAYKKGRIGRFRGVRATTQLDTVFLYDEGKVSFATATVKKKQVANAEKELEEKQAEFDRLRSLRNSYLAHLPNRRPTRGDIGRLPNDAEFLQPTGRGALVRTRLTDEAGVSFEYEFILAGVDLSDLTENTEFTLSEPLYVAEVESFTTVLGVTRRLAVIKPADRSLIADAIKATQNADPSKQK